MKKSLFLVAVLAVAASCSQNEVLETPTSNEIGFGTLSDRATRATVAGANDVDADYQVYAMHSEDATQFFIDDVVVGADDMAAAGPYFWPKVGTLNFYAYAPATAATATATAGATPSVTFDYTVATTGTEDLTVATPLTGLDKDANAKKAAFEFSHQLAKVSVDVVLDATSFTGYTLDGAWEATLALENDQLTGIDIVTPTSGTAGGNAIIYDNMTGADLSRYVVPDDATTSASTLTLSNVTVGNGTVVAYNAATFPAIDLSTALPAIVAGNHYKITVTLSGDQILFEAVNTTWIESDITLNQ